MEWLPRTTSIRSGCSDHPVECNWSTVGNRLLGHELWKSREIDTGVDILSLCSIAQTLPSQSRLVLGQQRALLSVLDTRSYPFAQVGGDMLTEEVKAFKEYKDAYQGYLSTKSTLESTLQEHIEWRVGFQGFTKDHIAAHTVGKGDRFPSSALSFSLLRKL